MIIVFFSEDLILSERVAMLLVPEIEINKRRILF